MPTTTPADRQREAIRKIADQCIAVRLRMLNRVITGVYDEALRPLGVTAGQVNILVLVATLDHPRQGEVGQALHMEKSTLSRNVERLRQKGWLDVVADRDDRAHRLRVTASGRRLIERVFPLWEEAQQEVATILGRQGERAVRAAAEGLWGARTPA